MEGNLPQQYPAQQPAQMYTGIPPKKGYVFLITMGIVILLLGGMITVSAGFLREPDMDDYVDSESYEEDREGYRYLQRLIPTIGEIIQFAGLIVFSIGILTGALTDMQLSPIIRLGMLVALAIIIGFKIGGTTIFYSF